MRHFAEFIFVGLVSLLVSCTSIPSAGIDSLARTPANGGLVAVQVMTNSAHLSDTLPNWSEVILVEQDAVGADGKPVITTLPALIDGLSTTRVFVGILKPGRYRFAGLYGFTHGSDFSHNMSAGAPRTVGTFEIQTDHLTNLGTVLFQPFQTDPLAHSLVNQPEKAPYAMSRLDDAAELSDFVSRRYPEQYKRTQANKELGWMPDQFGSLRNTLAAATKEYATLSLPHYLEQSRDIVYTARLGTLYRRQGDAKWSPCHLPTNYELLSYTEMADGGVLVGGERGGIWYAKKYCGEWQAIPLPDRLQNVVWVGARPGVAHVLAHEQRRYRIYESALDGNWNWRLIKEYGTYTAIDQREQIFHSEAAAKVIPEGNTWWLYDHDGGYRLDTDTGVFSATQSPAIYGLVVQPDGTVVALQSSAWGPTKPPEISRDHGHTWDQYQRLGAFSAVPYIFSNGDSLAVNSSTTFVFIGSKKNEKIELVLSHDKGKTSTVAGYVPYGCDQLETRISHDDLLFMRCFDGSLLHSVDRGQIWSVDFSRAVHADAIPHEFVASGIVAPSK